MKNQSLSIKQMCVISIIACIEAVMFTSFSNILYLETITLTILLFALVFPKRIALLGALVYGLVNMVLNGITPWSMMYLMIYPFYTFIVCALKPIIKNHTIGWSLVCALLSFLTGQLLQIPFLLISKKVTVIYLLTGLKTSVMQGMMSAVLCVLLFKPLKKVLEKIEGRLKV